VEKVVKKLRTSADAASGAPRSDEATVRLAASAIESTLDRAAASRPASGEAPASRIV
jgi:hypothetical protein